MAKRNDPVSRARGRKPAPVKKPFPLGFVLGSTALGAALIGILAYAFMNQGLGDKSSLEYAEHHVDGLQVHHDQDRNHRAGNVDYPDEATTPPDGGNHNGVPQSCQVYTTPIANEHAVHSLEHGAVWVTYNPDTLPKGDVAKLKDKVEGDPYRILSPYPGLKSKISLQAWGEQVFVDSVKDKAIDQFLDVFTSGPQAPERNGACQGSTEARSVFDLTAAAAATATPTPSGSTTPGPTPSATPSATSSATPSPTASAK
jgi:hypothetical protein